MVESTVHEECLLVQNVQAHVHRKGFAYYFGGGDYYATLMEGSVGTWNCIQFTAGSGPLRLVTFK